MKGILDRLVSISIAEIKTIAETFIHVTDPEIRDKVITDQAFTQTRDTRKQLVTETTSTRTSSATFQTYKASRVISVDNPITVHTCAKHASIANVSDISVGIAKYPGQIS